MNCSDACKLAGFNTATQVSGLAGISKRTLNYDFELRHRWREKPKFPARIRKAMDAKQTQELQSLSAKHQEERRIMELAIVEVMKKDVE